MEKDNNNIFPFLMDAAFDRFYSFVPLRLILENTTLPDVSEAPEQNEGRVFALVTP